MTEQPRRPVAAYETYQEAEAVRLLGGLRPTGAGGRPAHT